MESEKGEFDAVSLLQRSNLNLWQPENLQASGVEMVLAQAVYAIVGAIALERGGEEANQIVRERIIAPLGVQTKMLQGLEASQVQ